MLALSSWTWGIVAAILLLSLGTLIRVTIGLILRLKDLNRTLSAASEELQEVMEEMRGDLDRTSAGLAGLRRSAGDEDS